MLDHNQDSEKGLSTSDFQASICESSIKEASLLRSPVKSCAIDFGGQPLYVSRRVVVKPAHSAIRCWRVGFRSRPHGIDPRRNQNIPAAAVPARVGTGNCALPPYAALQHDQTNGTPGDEATLTPAFVAVDHDGQWGTGIHYGCRRRPNSNG